LRKITTYMTKINFWAICTTILCAIACANPESKQINGLGSQEKVFTKKECVDSSCLSILFSYPVLSGGNAGVTEAINTALQKTISSYIAWDTVYGLPLDSALYHGAKRLSAGFADYRREGPALATWEMETKAKTIYQSSKLISFEITGYTGMGGAHPNTSTELLTFDLSNGKPISVAAMLKDSSIVLPLLEAYFRESKEIPKDQSTLEHLLVPKFPMPANAAIVKEGIRFFYNPYEIAAYVYGPTDVLLSWDRLGAAADRKLWE
jgi:Deacetylase PdaC/Protein of unknown function (DUF3298)